MQRQTQAMADDAKADLAEALPALQAAIDSLKALNKSDITEVTGGGAWRAAAEGAGGGRQCVSGGTQWGGAYYMVCSAPTRLLRCRRAAD
jgi:hypothetical protein